MQKSKTLLTTFLSTLLILTPISALANTIATPTPNTISFPMPNTKDVAKKIAKVGRVTAVSFAVEKLFDGIDWVMDPANNRAITKNKTYCQMHNGPCVDNLADAEKHALRSIVATEWKYPFIGCQFHDTWGNGVIACTFNKDGDIRTIAFFNEGQKVVSHEQIAQEILNNASRGHPESVKFLREIAEEHKAKPPAPTQLDWGLSFKPTKPANPPLNPPMAIPKPENPTREPEQPKQCKPCKTITGRIVIPKTVGYRPLDVIPDNEMQHGVYGSHHNIFIANQSPPNSPKPCYCFWAKQKYVLKPHQLTPNMVPVEPFVN